MAYEARPGREAPASQRDHGAVRLSQFEAVWLVGLQSERKVPSVGRCNERMCGERESCVEQVWGFGGELKTRKAKENTPGEPNAYY